MGVFKLYEAVTPEQLEAISELVDAWKANEDGEPIIVCRHRDGGLIFVYVFWDKFEKFDVSVRRNVILQEACHRMHEETGEDFVAMAACTMAQVKDYASCYLYFYGCEVEAYFITVDEAKKHRAKHGGTLIHIQGGRAW